MMTERSPPDSIHTVIGAIGTFFGLLFILLVAIAVLSKGALKGPDAFVLRWTALSLAVVFSGVVAWLRWSISRPKVSTTAAGNRPGNRQPMKTTTGPKMSSASAAVAAAVRQAIVFRQHFPPRHDRGALSFFGGAPVAPKGFRWPRSTRGGAQSKPLSFLMQIDCAAVPRQARLGMLPDGGVLYFF